jgi:hypothetical protein
MRSHEDLIGKVRKILLNNPELSDEEFIKKFKENLPEITQHFRFRDFRIMDYLSDEYHEEQRTPLAIFHLQLIDGILNNAEEKNAEKRRLITELFTTGKIDPQEPTEPVARFQREVATYHDDVWMAFSRITDFYFQSLEQPDQVNVWDQILNGSLFNQDHIDALSYQLPQKLIKDFAQLVQILFEIDPQTVTLLQTCIAKIHKYTSADKIEFIFNFLEKLFVSGSDNEIFSIQDQEYDRLEQQEKKYIRFLYNFYVKDSKDALSECQPTESFSRLCHAIIYDNDFILPEECPELPELSKNKLYFLHRDIKYLFVKDELTQARVKSQARLDQIASLIQNLSTYCGRPLPIAASYPLPANASKREEFFHKHYSVPRVAPVHAWENHLVPIDLQKRRSRALNIKDVANLFSGGLSLGEGAVAGMGNYQMLMTLSPALAAAVVAPTLLGSAGCNYAIVVDDTEKTLDTLSSGLTQLHTNADKVELGWSRKILLWVFCLIPCVISGVCYGTLGGLSVMSTVGLILGFAGISMIPVVGWIIFAVVAVATLVTVFSILFELTRERIANGTYADVEAYFNKRFYWPKAGSRKDKAVAFFSNIFNGLRLVSSLVLITGLLFLTSAKLFAASLMAAFVKFAWGGSVAEKVASSLSYINSSLWLYFNFQKGSSLFDLLTPRSAAKIVPYIIETVARTVIFIVPALLCLLVQPVVWLWSEKASAICESWFEKMLGNMAPNWSSVFINKRILGRAHSGIDDFSENNRPVQISGGLIKCTLALCKLTPYVPEMAVRFGIGVGYKLLWPVRKIVRSIHNYACKKSSGYRTFSSAIGLKPRYREAYMGEIIVPKATHFVASKLSVAAHWLQQKIHNWRGVKADVRRTGADSMSKARNYQENTASVAVAGNSLGYGGAFAKGGAGQLPGFLKHTKEAAQEIMAGGPQFVCSEALNDGACKAMLEKSEQVPLTVVKNNKEIPATAKHLISDYKAAFFKPRSSAPSSITPVALTF